MGFCVKVIPGYLDGRTAISLKQRAMGSIIYLADHATVMTPLVVEAALRRCPVGTEAQRAGYFQELHDMGTRPDVDSATGVANDLDRRRFHHIREELRKLGLPLFRQKTIWPRLQDRWDLFWGKTTEPGRDILLRVPEGDLTAIINANQIPHPSVPDLAVRFLLRRRDSEVAGAKNPYIETELMRLAIHDPLRLYSRLGTAFYLDVLGKSSAENAGRMVGDMMERGLGGFDGRVIPMVDAVADRYEGAFTPEQMPTLVGLANKFPVLKNVFAKLRSKLELLEAALVACFDQHGRLVVVERVARSVFRAFLGAARDSFKSHLKEAVKIKDEANWRVYATLRFIRTNQNKQSVFFNMWRDMDLKERPLDFSVYSTPELMDLLVYLECDEQDSRLNSLRDRVLECLSHSRHDQISEDFFLFHEEPFKKSSKINGLAGEIMASHRPDLLH